MNKLENEKISESKEIEVAKMLHNFFATEAILITKFAEIHDKKACIPLWAYNSIKEDAQSTYDKLPNELKDYYRKWARKILGAKNEEENYDAD